MITQIRIKNFKAIKDSDELKLNPISCFIGYNGSGKSSVLEALLTLREMTMENLDKALNRWKGFENIQFKGTKRKRVIQMNAFAYNGVQIFDQPIAFKIKSVHKRKGRFNNYSAESFLTKYAEFDKILILKEVFELSSSKDYKSFIRDFQGQVYFTTSKKPNKILEKRFKIAMNKSLFSDQSLQHDINQWQFLRLNPDVMGEPYPEKRTAGYLGLNMDGSNVAEYLLSIKDVSLEAYEGILDTMISSILPYAIDLQSELTSAIDRKVYLSLTEKDYKVPGWLLSSGTLRILAILSVLRHPEPAPVVIIEELENGLDPRTIHVVINEIRRFVKQTGSQVIFTTHSPYLLDLMKLEEIVFVEKIDGEVKFSKPGDNDELKIWAEKFSPGKLYTMSRFNTV